MSKKFGHIFGVYELVITGRYSRKSAVREIAKKSGINPTTVAASCTRDIYIKTARLDEFLKPKNIKDFKKYLIKYFPNYRTKIENFFNNLTKAKL
ncbi:MAG: hypothetical protein JRJ44_04665 [Deltaproteobacteria bacterium]|nr:hypothetical protein [Deltaproteobacteria bacterium]